MLPSASLGLPDPRTGRRPFYGDEELFQRDPAFSDHVLFHEYFHGDTGQGLGADHQTGWTATIVNVLLALHEPR